MKIISATLKWYRNELTCHHLVLVLVVFVIWTKNENNLWNYWYTVYENCWIISIPSLHCKMKSSFLTILIYMHINLLQQVIMQHPVLFFFNSLGFRSFLIETNWSFSVLVDRDHKPQWKPSRIEDVTPDRVAWYLSALPADQELILWMLTWSYWCML